MSQQPTVLIPLKIDVSPNGIKLTIEGLDTDLAELIVAALDFRAKPIQFNSFESSNVVIESTRVIQFVDPPTT